MSITPGAAAWCCGGGIHAREWISPAVTINLIHSIAKERNFLPNGIDVYAVPMANPDGYEYSRTRDRMWNKNRRPFPSIWCKGVNLNRNWNYKFGIGASKVECSSVFKGSNPFSEPETTALSQKMRDVAASSDLKLVLTMHSFGGYLLYPWGWTNQEDAANTENMIRVGKAFKSKVKKVKGTVYKVASISSLGLASGSTNDWAKGVLGVPYSFKLILPDSGQFAFLFPPEEIRGTFNEVRKGIKALIKMVV